MTRWIPFGADAVLDLPADLYRAWPADLRPTAVSCALDLPNKGMQGPPGLDLGPGRTHGGHVGQRPPPDGRPESDLLQTWVTRAAVILAAGPVQAAFHIATEQFRIVVGAAVLGAGCCAVVRWHPWAGASAASEPADMAGGYLLGRIDAAAALPDLVAGLVPAGAVTVLGGCGIRDPGSHHSGHAVGEAAPGASGERAPGEHASEECCGSTTGETQGSSWMLHDCVGCPHDGSSPAARATAPHGGEPTYDLRDRVRQRVRADLLRCCLLAAAPGGETRPPASAGATGPAEGGHGS